MEQIASHDGPADGPEKPPAQVPLLELKERGGIMFSGITGAAVGSGRGEVTTKPSYGLAEAVIDLMDDLPPELFDRWAAHRPCGMLCKLGAAGMLICDVLGLPLVPWELAEPIGKAATKLKAKIPGEQAKAKKAAGRKGQDTKEQRRACSAAPCGSQSPAPWRSRGLGESLRKQAHRRLLLTHLRQ